LEERVKGLGADQKGKNCEGFSLELHAINTENLHFHMPMRDVGKWGMTNRIRKRVMHQHNDRTQFRPPRHQALGEVRFCFDLRTCVGLGTGTG